MSDNNNTTENTNNDNNTNNNKSNVENKQEECFFKRHSTFILYSIICITFLLVLICKYSKYTNESKTLIENSIKQFELNSQIQLSNYYEFLKETITNESFENKEFIKNTLEEAFKPNIDLLRETLKDSKDFSINTVTFWLAFLSLIMIIFTILGIYANNKIMESNQKQSELIIKETKLESNKTLEELDKKAQEMELTLKKIEEQTKQSKINADKSKVSELFARALNEQMNKNYDEAIKLYTEALEIDPINIMSLNNRGNVYSDKYKETKYEEYFKKALEDYTTIIKNNPNYTFTLNNRANLYSNKFRKTKYEEYFSKALDDYSKILSINENDINALNNRGSLYSNKYEETKDEDYFKKALNDYNKVLSIDKKNINVLINRGILYSNKFRKTKEEKYFNNTLENYNKVLNINKNYYGIYIAISFLYLNHYEVNKEENKESLTQAEKYLNEGLKLYPNNFELINNYGMLLYFKYKENKAIDNLTNSEMYLKKAIDDSRIKENIGETYYYLSLVYDEYAKLDENISGYSKEECKNKSDEYLQKSKDLGYKHFMDK
ncbi:tetratricopeptide repeat protein [Brachyspira hyodysenteriae]|uniref:tetratricopeptide repeat protein n=1 Tax=Brachyspira hyodysenteriae TaxID=159 RepID=UPI000A14F142|nr:tetratricopeptide repeat protein [Brachyspira hyodysenteriae]